MNQLVVPNNSMDQSEPDAARLENEGNTSQDLVVVKSPYDSFPYWWTPAGFCKRCVRNKFIRFFSFSNGEDVTVAEMDSLVSLFSLIAAFVLAVPFGVMTSLQSETLQSTKDILDSCPKDDMNEQLEFQFRYNILVSSMIQAVYSALITIILSLLYYILRPGELQVEQLEEENKELADIQVSKAPKARRRLVLISALDQSRKSQLFVNNDLVAAANLDFRKWWQRGKIVVFLIALGTTYAVVVLCFLFNYYMSAFVVPADELCSFTFFESISSKLNASWSIAVGILFLMVYVLV
eukprot:gene31051-37529_t